MLTAGEKIIKKA